MPEVRLGEVVVVVCVVVWCLSREEMDGDEERRRWKREGLRAGVLVTGGGVGSRREPKRGIVMVLGVVSWWRRKLWKSGLVL